MRVLINLKYIPSKIKDYKGDLLMTNVKAHKDAGFEIVL